MLKDVQSSGWVDARGTDQKDFPLKIEGVFEVVENLAVGRENLLIDPDILFQPEDVGDTLVQGPAGICLIGSDDGRPIVEVHRRPESIPVHSIGGNKSVPSTFRKT